MGSRKKKKTDYAKMIEIIMDKLNLTQEGVAPHLKCVSKTVGDILNKRTKKPHLATRENIESKYEEVLSL
ncbi:MAG: hypothetical protein KAS32_14475 [Candidatus Peribacteraceae bacterium]|nr:hypothetical protein [Candidatus Peribacteraceae bacterium]